MGKRYTQEEYKELVKQRYDGKYIVVGGYTNSLSKVKLKCTQCGTEFDRIASSVLRTRSGVCCPLCDNHLITRSCLIEGVNDLWTTHKDIAAMLKNPEDGHKYSAGSNQKVSFICNKCGHVSNKVIAQVVRYGYSCPYCSDGVKYPNKFMSCLLSLNNIDFDTEYTINNYDYRYDFHFIINDVRHLIEMDGGLNHGCVDLPNMSIEEQNLNDLNKDILATDHGYKLIRIDCKYPDVRDRFLYIKNNIIKSDLRYLLNDLSDETLNKCDNIAANTSLIVEIANAWNDGICSQCELQEKFKVGSQTIRSRLKIASKIGLINGSYESIQKTLKESGIRKRSYTQGCAVMCNETGEVFSSISDARGAGYTTVSAYLNNKIKYSGKLSDGTELTWKRITKEEYEKLRAS